MRSNRKPYVVALEPYSPKRIHQSSVCRIQHTMTRLRQLIGGGEFLGAARLKGPWGPRKFVPANWYGSKCRVLWDGVALNALGFVKKQAIIFTSQPWRKLCPRRHPKFLFVHARVAVADGLFLLFFPVRVPWDGMQRRNTPLQPMRGLLSSCASSVAESPNISKKKYSWLMIN